MAGVNHSRRALAVHECGHAVVAAHLGALVHSVAIRDGQGATLHHGAANARDAAVITCAGEVAQRLAGLAAYDYACGDLKVFEQRYGLAALPEAERRAAAILTGDRATLMGLAVRLERDGRIDF